MTFMSACVFLLSQELTCREELLTLLLSLLPLVWKIPVLEEKAPGGYMDPRTAFKPLLAVVPCSILVVHLCV